MFGRFRAEKATVINPELENKIFSVIALIVESCTDVYVPKSEDTNTINVASLVQERTLRFEASVHHRPKEGERKQLVARMCFQYIAGKHI